MAFHPKKSVEQGLKINQSGSEKFVWLGFCCLVHTYIYVTFKLQYVCIVIHYSLFYDYSCKYWNTYSRNFDSCALSVNIHHCIYIKSFLVNILSCNPLGLAIHKEMSTSSCDICMPTRSPLCKFSRFMNCIPFLQGLQSSQWADCRACMNWTCIVFSILWKPRNLFKLDFASCFVLHHS